MLLGLARSLSTQGIGVRQSGGQSGRKGKAFQVIHTGPSQVTPTRIVLIRGMDRTTSRTMSTRRPEVDELCEGGLREEPPAPSPDDVVSERGGDVLIKNTILKSDHFPGCQNMKLTPLIDGAPNFRQVTFMHLHGPSDNRDPHGSRGPH
jgi:hypothetical protein